MVHNIVVRASNDTMSALGRLGWAFLRNTVFPPDPDPVFSDEEDTNEILIDTKIKMRMFQFNGTQISCYCILASFSSTKILSSTIHFIFTFHNYFYDSLKFFSFRKLQLQDLLITNVTLKLRQNKALTDRVDRPWPSGWAFIHRYDITILVARKPKEVLFQIFI